MLASNSYKLHGYTRNSCNRDLCQAVYCNYGRTVSSTDYSCKRKWAASPNTRHWLQQAKLRNVYKITVRLARTYDWQKQIHSIVFVNHMQFKHKLIFATGAVTCFTNTSVCRTACTWVRVTYFRGLIFRGSQSTVKNTKITPLWLYDYEFLFIVTLWFEDKFCFLWISTVWHSMSIGLCKNKWSPSGIDIMSTGMDPLCVVSQANRVLALQANY